MDKNKIFIVTAVAILFSGIAVAQDGVQVNEGVVVNQPGQSSTINSSDSFTVSDLTAYSNLTRIDSSNFTINPFIPEGEGEESEAYELDDGTGDRTTATSNLNSGDISLGYRNGYDLVGGSTFEDGEVPEEWYDKDSNFQVYSNSLRRPFTGNYSAGMWGNSPSDGVAARYTTDELDGGKQIDSLTVHYLEDGSQSGHAFVLYNSNGEWEVAFGSQNPQPFVEDGDGTYSSLGQFGPGRYNAWMKVRLQFNWSNDSYRYSLTNELESQDNTTVTTPWRSLDKGVDIQSMALRQSGPLGTSGSASHVLADDIEFQVDRPSNELLHYRMDADNHYWEQMSKPYGTGIAEDSSGNNNYGYVQGDTERGYQGVFNTTAFDFPGNFGNAINSTVDKSLQNGSFTILTWIKPDDVSNGGKRIVYKDANTGWAYSLGDPGAGRLRFYMRSSNNVLADTGDIINTDEWYCTAAVNDNVNNERRIYVDGQEEVSVSSDVSSTNSDYLYIGAQNNGGKPYNGQIEELKIVESPYNSTDISEYCDATQPFNGTYTSPNKQLQETKNWRKIEVDTNIPDSTSANLTFNALDSSNSTIDTHLINLKQGTKNYTLPVQNSAGYKVEFNGLTQNVTETWQIDSYEVYTENETSVDVGLDNYNSTANYSSVNERFGTVSNFSATPGLDSSTVEFKFTELLSNDVYSVVKNQSANIKEEATDSSGNFNFTNNQWSTQNFSVRNVKDFTEFEASPSSSTDSTQNQGLVADYADQATGAVGQTISQAGQYVTDLFIDQGSNTTTSTDGDQQVNEDNVQVINPSTDSTGQQSFKETSIEDSNISTSIQDLIIQVLFASESSQVQESPEEDLSVFESALTGSTTDESASPDFDIVENIQERSLVTNQVIKSVDYTDTVQEETAITPIFDVVYNPSETATQSVNQSSQAYETFDISESFNEKGLVSDESVINISYLDQTSASQLIKSTTSIGQDITTSTTQTTITGTTASDTLQIVSGIQERGLVGESPEENFLINENTAQVIDGDTSTISEAVYSETVGDTSVITQIIDPTTTFVGNPTADAESSSIVDPVVSFVEQAFQEITPDTSIRNNLNPEVTNVEVNATGLQNSVDIKLNISVRDQNGNLNEVIVNGEGSKDVTGFNDSAVIDISDELDASYTITVLDSNGKLVTEDIGFDIDENTPANTGTNDDIDQQEVEFDDSIENTGQFSLDYRITHNLYSGSLLTGGTNTGTVDIGEEDNFKTRIEGDFLEETTQWHTDPDSYNTVDNQTIEETLNITSEIPGTPWNSISTLNTTSPEPFGSCSNCNASNISFTDSYSNLEQWSDTGDGINNEFVQDIADVNIGERTEWWEEYRYNNLTAEVRFKHIWANTTVDENQTEYLQPFVRVKEGNTFNNTYLVQETDACTSRDTDIPSFKLSGQTWKACAQDRDNNGQAEYFRIRIPEFSTERVRYGLGESPEDQFEYKLGDPCPDSIEGETFNNDSLICFRNEVIRPDEAQLETRDVSIELGQGIAGLLIAALIIIVIYLILSDRRNIDIGRGSIFGKDEDDGGFGYDP